MASLAARKKARRLLAALGLPPGRAHVVVGRDRMTVRLSQDAKPKVRPTRFEGTDITYEYRKSPSARDSDS